MLILDKIAMVEARELSASLYSVSNGAGKARAARDGSLREPKDWRVLFVSSGELPVGTKLAEDRGRKARAGQLIRLVDVAVERKFGAFDSAGPADDAAALVKEFKLAATTAYGTAGPAFVRALIAEEVTGEDVRAAFFDFVGKHVPPGSDWQVDRAAQRFGLIAVAGELAIMFGIAPWSPGKPTEAAAWALKEWIERRGGTEPAEVRQAVEQVRLFIEQHGESRFDSLDDPDARPVQNRAGWKKGAGEHREWYIPPEAWKEVCTGLAANSVAKVLSDRGILSKGNDGNQKAGKPMRVYAVTSRIFDGGDHAA